MMMERKTGSLDPRLFTERYIIYINKMSRLLGIKIPDSFRGGRAEHIASHLSALQVMFVFYFDL